MLRSIEGVNITRNKSCYSFLKEEIFQFYKAIGYGYSSEKDVLSWISFFNLANWQKCTWSWWSGWNQEFPCRQLAWPFFRVIFSGFHEDCFRNCAYKKNLSLIVCLSLKWSVKWFRITDFTTMVRKLDRFINHTLFGCDIRGLIQVINNNDTTPTIRVFSSSLIYFCRITMSDMVGGGDGGREGSGEGSRESTEHFCKIKWRRFTSTMSSCQITRHEFEKAPALFGSSGKDDYVQEGYALLRISMELPWYKDTPGRCFAEVWIQNFYIID